MTFYFKQSEERFVRPDSVAGDMALAQSKLVKAEAELARLTKERNATVEDIEAVLSGLRKL